jgi:linoleoyl-CoA desaturase
MQKVAFGNNNPSFTITLKKRVDEYFASNNLEFTGGRKLYSKTIILLSIAAALYWLLLFANLPAYISLPLCGLMGLTFAGIGFNVMHDGGHGSYSRKPWVNEAMSLTLNLLGGNAYLWKIKHNNNHHSFTNIEGMDEDIDIRPFMRTSTDQDKKWFHKYQHIYWVALYCMVYFAWIFMKDFKKYFSGKIADTYFRKMDRREHIIFWGSKVLYIGIFLVVPMLTVGVLPTLAGYAIMSAVCGLTLGIIFQLAHVIEGTSVHSVSDEPVRQMDDWTIHQLSTTANFSTRNKIMSWFAGGLNFQVEHHLFPRISHIHYPALNTVVKEVCAQFNVKYMEYPSFFTALRSHVAYLKVIGSSK